MSHRGDSKVGSGDGYLEVVYGSVLELVAAVARQRILVGASVGEKGNSLHLEKRLAKGDLQAGALLGRGHGGADGLVNAADLEPQLIAGKLDDAPGGVLHGKAVCRGGS